MLKEVYTITCSALPDGTVVAGFRGAEALSRTYEIHLYLQLGLEGNDLDFADTIGSKAKLELSRADGRPPFLFNGVLAEFELIHQVGDQSLFHATLVPQLWLLTQTFHSRLWTDKSIKDIIEEVLQDGGLSGRDFEFQLTQTYKSEEHVCQYKESDFDFISRWMEREGMYYYFDQGDGGEKLIITDSKSKHGSLDATPVRFHQLSGHDGSSGEALHTFTCKHRALPGSVKVVDYDYTKPALDMSGEAAVSQSGLGEIIVYGDRFFTPDDGKRLATVRSEELLARQVVYRGTGTEFHLRTGYLFELEDHPRGAFNQEYLAIEIEHVGNQQIASPELRALTGIHSDKVYHVEVKAIPSATQFRPVRATPWPRIYGFENGTVCGPASSTYAQIDDHGRYNVKFKFDESSLKDGNASTWVRMMQPHGGNPEGFHFPLRKGTEVVFSFMGGDPDRPVIAGVVSDTTHPSPITSANHTRNIIHTGGDNHFELEDQAGQQRVTLSTPTAKTHILMGHPQDGYEFIARTEGNSLQRTDKNHDHKIGGDGTRTTEGEQEEETKKSHTFKVGEDWEVTIGEDKKEMVIGNTEEIFIGTKKETTIGSTTELMVGSETATKISTAKETTVGDKTEINVSDSLGLTVGNSAELTIANKAEVTVGNVFETTIGTQLGITVGKVTELALAEKFELTVGASVGIMIGPSLEVQIGPAVKVFSSPEIEVGPESAEAKAQAAEMKAVQNELKGARTAIAGLRQATIGVANAACGAKTEESVLQDITAGLSASNAGLHAMN